MRKIILFGLVIISIFLFGCTETELDKDDNFICDSDEKEEEPAGTHAKTEEIKEEPKIKEIKTAKVGEKVIVDDVSYSVEKVRTLSQIGDYIGDTLFGVKADGRFYAVFLNIENIGKESQNMFSNRFIIVDDKDRRYDPDSEAEIYYEQAISFGEQIQPNLPITGAKVFDLPKEATGLKLEISGDWTSTSKFFVDIDKAWVTT